MKGRYFIDHSKVPVFKPLAHFHVFDYPILFLILSCVLYSRFVPNHIKNHMTVTYSRPSSLSNIKLAIHILSLSWQYLEIRNTTNTCFPGAAADRSKTNYQKSVIKSSKWRIKITGFLLSFFICLDFL